VDIREGAAGSPSSPIEASVAKERISECDPHSSDTIACRHMPKRCAGAGLRGRPFAGQHDSGRLPGAQWPFTEKQNRESPG